MIRLHRVPALAAALFLQVAPLIRTAEPVAAAVLQPLAILFRWAAGVAALAGSVHAVSGATGLISAPSVDGTKGQTLVYRAQIVSDDHGIPESYSATGLPPGLAITALGPLRGTVQGIPAGAGSFNAQITGWKTRVPGEADSFTATVRFLIADAGPTIVTPPASQVVAVGTRVELSVVAEGADLTYQWINDDIEVPDGTANPLVLDPVTKDHVGTYRVRVSNAGGTTSSGPAELAVLDPPVIIQSPTGGTFTDGSAVTLAVTVSGDAPLAFQWFLGPDPIPDATSDSLTLDPIRPVQEGSYTVTVSNVVGSATSDPAVVIVGSVPRPPSIVGMRVPPTLHTGEAARIEVTVESPAAVSGYQWRDSTGPISGAVGAVLELPPFVGPGSSEYDVVISANGVSTTSAPVRITVVGPLILASPERIPGGLSLRFVAVPGRRYQLESNPGLDPAAWTPVADPFVPGNPEGITQVPLESDAGRLLRLRALAE